MSDVRRVLAVDLGASSGRVIAAQLRDGLASTRPSRRGCDAEATCAAPSVRVAVDAGRSRVVLEPVQP